MKTFSRPHHESLNELNITPLLDLAFVLLVIFIIATPQLVNHLEMNLPTPQQAQPATPPPRPNNVTVEDGGGILFNNQPITLADLEKQLAELRRGNPDLSVVFRGGNGVTYQRIVDVLDLFRRLDIEKVGLATDNAEL